MIEVLPDGTLLFDKWVKTGDMISSNRDCLDPDDPRQTYNYLVSEGVVPEEYGIASPYETLFKGVSRGELMTEVVRLRRELSGVYQWL